MFVLSKILNCIIQKYICIVFYFKQLKLQRFLKLQLLLYLFTLFSTVGELNAQIDKTRFDRVSLNSEFSLENWTTLHGLSSNALNAFVKDANGYIWLTSHEGIIRFDGYEFEKFKMENTPVLPGNSFFHIVANKDSSLYFFSDNGYVRFNKKFSKTKADELKYNMLPSDKNK